MPRAGADAVFIGKRVRQRFVGFGVHHGTVKRQEMDGSFTVLFDDGDELPYSKAALFDIMLDPPPIPQPVPAPAPGGTAAGKRKASADPARPAVPAANPAKPKRCTASDPCAACTNSIAARPPAAAERLGIDPTQLVTEVDGLKLHLSSTNRTGYHGVQFSPTTNANKPYTVEFRGAASGGQSRPVKIGQCATALEGAVLYARHALQHAPYAQPLVDSAACLKMTARGATCLAGPPGGSGRSYAPRSAT